MDPKKYNKLLTSGRWSNKDPKDAHILALFVVAQNIADDSNKASDKSNTSNRESPKGELEYTRDLPPWMPEETKCGVKKQGRKGILVAQVTLL